MIEKKTFTCDQTGEKYNLVLEGCLTIDNTKQMVITPTEKPKVFNWDQVADGVLVKYEDEDDDTHFLFDRKEHVTHRLRLSERWQVWMGGEQPLPDYVKVQARLRNNEHTIQSAKDLAWMAEGIVTIGEIIAFRLIDIGDYKYPDEV